MEDVKVTRLINGPEAFTPDNEFCLGESEVRGLFVAAGFCAHGLAGAGGIGKVMAEWIVAGEPHSTCGRWTSAASGPSTARPRYTLARAKEVYETYYDIRYPGHERQAGRPLRTSSAYAWHREHGAAFGEKSGWERVNWYESNAAAGDEALRPRGWAGLHWSPAIGAEALATRTAAGLFDESSFAKLEISGAGAAAAAGAAVRQPRRREVGRITYTQMLNRRGGIECDFTVTRVGPETFQIVTGTAFGKHDAAWIRRHLPARRLGHADRRHLALGLLRAVGPACAADPGAADPGPARLRLHADARAGRRRRAGPGAARHLRRRDRLGAVLPDRVRRRAVADAVGGRSRRTDSSPAATARSTRCGWRRATASGPPTSPPTRLRWRPAWASASGTIARSSAPTRCGEPTAAAALPRARGPALGRARQRARAGRTETSAGG